MKGNERSRPGWFRLPDETQGEWSLFEAFLRQGIARTVVETARQCGVSYSLATKVSARRSWTVRAAAFDSELERCRLAKVMESRERQAVLEAENVERALKLVRHQLDREIARVEAGKAPTMKPSELTTLLDVATKLSRVGRGEVGDRSEVVSSRGDDARKVIEAELDRISQRREALGAGDSGQPTA